MNKILDYKIAANNHEEELEIEVKGLIADGWQPFGGLQACVPVLDGVPAPLYSQAMVKYENK